MLEITSSDFVRTARAKGLPPTRIFLRHQLRNAILPLVTGPVDIVIQFHPPMTVEQAGGRKALARKTGARGLRSIMEQSLIDTMFELPTLDGVAKVVLDKHTIEDEAKPLLVYREQAKASA